MGTVLEVDGELWSWLYGVMLQKTKRVQVLKCCPQLLGPLLCSSPSSCGVALSRLSFPALVRSLFPSSCPQGSGA